MSEPNPPSQPKANGPGDSTGSNPVQFNSTTSAKANQPKDYFAEQNKKQAEKKQKTKKIRMLAILISVVVVLALVAVIVFLLSSHSGPVVEDVNEDSGATVESSLAGVDKLTTQIEEVYNPTYSIEDGELKVDGDIEAAEAMYQAALANPANKSRLNTIRLSQIVFYSSIMMYQRVVEVAEEVTPSELNLSERLRFYNLTYLAYSALGNKEKANMYYLLTHEIADQVEGYSGE